jgi:hypothetical protein
MKNGLALGVLLLASAACDADPPVSMALDEAAERYVKLALELGEYDHDYVDAYIGPPEWAESVSGNPRPRDELASAIRALLSDLEAISPGDALQERRHQSLLVDVRGMDTRMRMLLGETFSFAEEARRIYGVTVPVYDFAEFDRALEEIDRIMPGEGDLADRVDAFRSTLVIPEPVRDAVIDTAIKECRRRTLEHLRLPDDESYTLEYVTGQTWSGYNWYKGGDRSLMQINVDFPPKIDAAIRLGCHEGYPGHHVWNVLVESRLLRQAGWIEFTVFPLFSAKGLIGEGSANYGVELAFPGREKTDYEREVLFPLAGLDPEAAEMLEALDGLTTRLSHSLAATAQLYLDGAISREEAIEQRRKYSLSSRSRAEQSVRFIEQYRSYVLNYSLGRDIVRDYIERQADDRPGRWRFFEQVLTGLLSASDMTG